MAPLIAPGCCRYTVNATYSGNPVANIVDMFIDTTGSGLSREQAVLDVANDILSNWDDHWQPTLVSQLVLQSVTWVDLDESDGSTGTVTDSGAHNWPRAGASTDPAMPANVSVLITKVAPGGGRKFRNGRMYLCGLGEGLTPGNDALQMDIASQAALQARADAFHSGIHDTGGVGDSSRYPVVIHTEDIGTEDEPNIVFRGASEVTSLIVQRRLATQRRRLRP